MIASVMLLSSPAWAAEPTCTVSGEIPAGATFIGYTRTAESTLRSFGLLLETRGWLGIKAQPITPELAQRLSPNDLGGALVAGVAPASPAAEAGLAPVDVVVAFDGQKLEEWRDLLNLAAVSPPGKQVQVVVVRNGVRRTVRVKMGSLDDPDLAYRLVPYDGHSLAPGQTLHALLGDSQITIQQVEPYLERAGIDHCVYPATLGTTSGDSWVIWASRPALRGRVRRPTSSEVSRFRSRGLECVVQGDYPEGEEPPCTRPELVAVSDLDADQRLEQWHTVPYIWDTGLRLAEEDEAGEFVSVLYACPGCSD